MSKAEGFGENQDNPHEVHIGSKILTELLQRVGERIGDKAPSTVSVSDLSRTTTDVLTTTRDQDAATLVTYRGVPRFVLVPLAQDDEKHLTDRISETAGADIFTAANVAGEEEFRSGNVTAPPTMPTELPQE